MKSHSPPSDIVSSWPEALYQALKDGNIRQATYVPDAGHSRIIELLHEDPDVQTTVLTTEEEGVAMAAGAWLGGERSVLLMQSSGVGNCINMLSLVSSCRLPFLSIVTMRGEWAEFNPWQIPMSRATAKVLELMQVQTLRVEMPANVYETVAAAIDMAYHCDQAVAVLLSQQWLGRKQWLTK